jgi:hypothetical protein
LIPKPQKDLEMLKNWRPITLLNQDYKYLTKLLANRLEKKLGEIISTDQSGFVKGRYIGCNIQRIQNTIEMCKMENLNGTLVNIDFEKAFDTIEWHFIYKSLEILNFPQKFIEWIRSLYSNIETCIINNGNTSNYFNPERGVRQGCPISPYLFIITTEIMNRWIKEKMKNLGIQGKDKEDYLIAQFADDTSFSLKSTHKAIHELFSCLESYGKISGLKLNIEKTEILRLGDTTESDIPKRYRKYIKNEVNYLGCIIHTDQDKTTKINITTALDKLNKQLEKWNHRATTLSGKVAIIKSLLIPQVTYILTTMMSPEEEKLKELEQNLYKFLNNGGSEKIKRKILIGEYEEGGYKMTDIKSYIKAIKICWLTRLIKMEGIWKEKILKILKIDPEYMLRCNIKYTDLPFIKDLRKLKLWEEIIKYWCEENFDEDPQDANTILNQSIWMNSHIKINKKTVYWEKWYKEGFKWVADLTVMDDKGKMKLMSFAELKDFDIPGFDMMKYNSLISSIPKKWKKILSTETNLVEEEGESYLLNRLLNQKKPMKYMYNILKKKKSERPTSAIEKWREDLNIDTTDEHILNGHEKNHYCTINNRLKSFNCNFINRNIPYNRRLHKMGKKETTICEFCNKEEETIIHLYWECTEIKKLWNNIKTVYNNLTGENIEINKEICLLFPSKTKYNKRTESLRVLFLLTKHYIHLTKCKENKKPREKDLEMYIKNHLKIERESSKNREKEGKFLAIWEDWIPWIEE